jgi:hypothetical protein
LAIELTARVLDFMTDTAAADIARAESLAGRAFAASPRSLLAHFAKGQVLRAGPLRRGHSRIRDCHCAQPQLG